MNKAAIIVGHTKLRPGACSPHGLPCEWPLNSAIADHLIDVADIYHHESYNFGYTHMVRTTANKINEHPYSLVLELHYNAAHPAANGCEALYYFQNKTGKILSHRFTELYTTRIGGRDRGAKALVSPQDRGFGAVYYTRPTTLLLEPFFGTNLEDVNRFKACFNEYVNVIRTLIQEAT